MEFSIKMGFAKWGIQFCRMKDSVWQRKSFVRETRLSGNSTKTFTFILAVKDITCNTKVGEIISFCDFFFFRKAMQVAVISRKKTTITRGYFRNCELPLYP